MNIDGTLQVLAEEAINVEDIDEAVSPILQFLFFDFALPLRFQKARQELEAAQRKSAEGGSEVDRAEAQIRAEVAEALIKAATGQAQMFSV